MFVAWETEIRYLSVAHAPIWIGSTPCWTCFIRSAFVGRIIEQNTPCTLAERLASERGGQFSARQLHIGSVLADEVIALLGEVLCQCVNFARVDEDLGLAATALSALVAGEVILAVLMVRNY